MSHDLNDDPPTYCDGYTAPDGCNVDNRGGEVCACVVHHQWYQQGVEAERARWRSVLQPYVLRCVRHHGSDELVERLERALGIRGEHIGGHDAPPP